MGMAVLMDYKVTTTRKEVIPAALPLQEHTLPLSNLDLLLPPLDVSVFFCYKSVDDGLPTCSNSSAAVGALKKAMAKALVTYYAFAGELATNAAGEPELLCNNRGVDFLEASADVELRDLRLCDPDICVGGKLVPKKKDGVMCAQVTELQCGGMVVACTFDHRVADAYSANMFLVAWAETARSQAISLAPSFDRSFLNPRQPLRYDDSISDLYVLPMSTLISPPPPKSTTNDLLLLAPPPADCPSNRLFYITAEDILRLQSLSSPAAVLLPLVKRSTKLEAFSAYLWKAVAKCSRQNAAPACSLGVVVDGRSRLARGGASAATYFGNVLSIPYKTLGREQLAGMQLWEVAAAVHETIRAAATEEHFRGLVDWVEARRPEPAAARVYCGEGEDGVAVVVSSGRRFPVSEVEFGWGKPVFGSYHFPWGGSAGYVMPMPSAKGNGDWVVYVHLKRGLMEAVEEETREVMRPLSSEYLGIPSESW